MRSAPQDFGQAQIRVQFFHRYRKAHVHLGKIHYPRQEIHAVGILHSRVLRNDNMACFMLSGHLV